MMRLGTRVCLLPLCLLVASNISNLLLTWTNHRYLSGIQEKVALGGWYYSFYTAASNDDNREGPWAEKYPLRKLRLSNELAASSLKVPLTIINNGAIAATEEKVAAASPCQPHSRPLRIDENGDLLCQCMVEAPICGGTMCGHEKPPHIDINDYNKHNNNNNNNINKNNEINYSKRTIPQMVYPAKCGHDCQCVPMSLPFYGCEAEDILQANMFPHGLGSWLNNLMLMSTSAIQKRLTLNYTSTKYRHGCSAEQTSPYTYTCLLYPVSPCPDLVDDEMFNRSYNLHHLPGGAERRLARRNCCNDNDYDYHGESSSLLSASSSTLPTSSSSSMSTTSTTKSSLFSKDATTTCKCNEIEIRTAAAKRVLRFIPSVERKIQEYESHFDTSTPFLGFHIRRGDKLKHEADPVPLVKYVEVALDMMKKMEMPTQQNNIIRRALVASDSLETANEMIQLLSREYGIHDARRLIIVDEQQEQQEQQDQQDQQQQQQDQQDQQDQQEQQEQQQPNFVVAGADESTNIVGGRGGYNYHTFKNLPNPVKLDGDCMMLAEARTLAKSTVMVGTVSSNIFRLVLAFRGSSKGMRSVDKDRKEQTGLNYLYYWNENDDDDDDDDDVTSSSSSFDDFNTTVAATTISSI